MIKPKFVFSGFDKENFEKEDKIISETNDNKFFIFFYGKFFTTPSKEGYCFYHIVKYNEIDLSIDFCIDLKSFFKINNFNEIISTSGDNVYYGKHYKPSKKEDFISYLKESHPEHFRWFLFNLMDKI